MALQGQAGKKYGLIIRKSGDKAAPAAAASSVFEKPKVARPSPAAGFEHSSDSELERSDGDEKEAEKEVQMSSSKKLAASDYLRMKVRAETQKDIDKALAEDPTCFQYDEVYDEISHTSTMERAQAVNKTVERKPKYIEGLLKTAEHRKRDYERRVERQIQKEREAEGAQFEDKEAFVTSGYREKLKQMKEDEERERAQEAIDAKMDVTKQGDLSMFYRNLLEQQTSQPANKPEPEQKTANEEKKEEVSRKEGDEERRHSNRRSRSRSRERHHRHERSQSPHRSLDRDRHRKKSRSRSPSDTAHKRRSRSPPALKKEEPKKQAVAPPANEPNKEVASSIFEKRNVGESVVLSAKERYLQRKMQRNLPTSDD